MKKMLCIISFLIMVNNAYGSCAVISGQSVTISFSGISTPKDTPIGTVIATGSNTFYGRTYGCGAGAGAVYYNMAYGGNASGISNVYDTNIPGVGIRAYYDYLSNLKYYFTKPAYAQTFPASSAGASGSTTTKWIVELVKTGDIQPGALTSGLVSYLTADGSSATGLSLYIAGNINVIQTSCAVTTKAVSVTLDDMLTSKFTQVGTTTGDKNFTIGLSCDVGTKINVSLNGTQNADTSDGSVLALSNTGSNGTASGVGIQILSSGSPLKINQNMYVKTAVGQVESLPFTARYYQTKGVVTTGSASATATLNITYQ